MNLFAYLENGQVFQSSDAFEHRYILALLLLSVLSHSKNKMTMLLSFHRYMRIEILYLNLNRTKLRLPWFSKVFWANFSPTKHSGGILGWRESFSAGYTGRHINVFPMSYNVIKDRHVVCITPSLSNAHRTQKSRCFQNDYLREDIGFFLLHAR